MWGVWSQFFKMQMEGIMLFWIFVGFVVVAFVIGFCRPFVFPIDDTFANRIESGFAAASVALLISGCAILFGVFLYAGVSAASWVAR
jgi:hypothetical protein